jgi:NADH-quinone oxidoreductase subunit J
VAVLFLFVVMMLDVDFTVLKQGFLQYLPLGATVGAIVLIELILVVGGWTLEPANVTARAAPIAPNVTNTAALGRILYTQYIYFFQAAGFILLTAMIGSIVLTLRHRRSVKRQNIDAQNLRDRKVAVQLRKVPSRVGL